MYEARLDAYVNESAREWRCEGSFDEDIWDCHESLPYPHHPTPLILLPSHVQAHYDVGAVLYKDESGRFGNTSFKPFGATWACYKTICAGLGLPTATAFGDVAAQLATKPFQVTLHAASDGRWGQAVATMAQWLRIKARIYVPNSSFEIMSEACNWYADWVDVEGDYDRACRYARRAVRDLNRGAEENADPEIMPMLDAVGWRYDDDAMPGHISFVPSTLDKDEEAENQINKGIPQVSGTEVEEEDDYSLSHLKITVVEEAGEKKFKYHKRS